MSNNIDMKSYREQILNLKGGQINEVYFIDTKPNFIYVTNLGTGDVFCSENPNVSGSRYDIVVSENMKRSIVKPLGIHKLYVYPQVDTQVKIDSGIANISMSDIPSTQIIATVGQAIQVSKLDVDKIIQPLPTGSNKIGMVSVESWSSMITLLTDIKNLITTTNTLLTTNNTLSTTRNTLLTDIKNKP